MFLMDLDEAYSIISVSLIVIIMSVVKLMEQPWPNGCDVMIGSKLEGCQFNPKYAVCFETLL